MVGVFYARDRFVSELIDQGITFVLQFIVWRLLLCVGCCGWFIVSKRGRALSFTGCLFNNQVFVDDYNVHAAVSSVLVGVQVYVQKAGISYLGCYNIARIEVRIIRVSDNGYKKIKSSMHNYPLLGESIQQDNPRKIVRNRQKE